LNCNDLIDLIKSTTRLSSHQKSWSEEEFKLLIWVVIKYAQKN